jgi:hypothetical protein
MNELILMARNRQSLGKNLTAKERCCSFSLTKEGFGLERNLGAAVVLAGRFSTISHRIQTAQDQPLFLNFTSPFTTHN